MKHVVHLFLVLCVGFLLLSSCDPSSAFTEVSLNAIVEGSSRADDDDDSVRISPSNYKMALTYFALIKDDGDTVTIIEEETPEVHDFSSSVPLSGLLLGRKIIPKGTYIGYEMRFTYIEMDLFSSFDVPAGCPDETHTLVTNSEPDSGTDRVHHEHTFRMYFNTDDKFYKRYFVVKTGEDDSENPIWSWMRWTIEEKDEMDGFFITQDTHPTTNMIDLFHNEEFWGDEADYDNPDTLITISTEDDTGAVDANMDPVTIKVDTTLLLTINIANTFDFKDDVGTVYDNDMLDIGPFYDAIPLGEDAGDMYYGDHGYHPMMPVFTLTAK